MNHDQNKLMAHPDYPNLPPLAGLCSFEEASRRGLSVEDCVERLRRYHYTLTRLHQILTARITAEPIYELKMAMSHHAYLCAEHVASLRLRVREMRDPPLKLERIPHPGLEALFDEILSSLTTAELLVGVYEKAMPVLDAGLQRHREQTNLLADAPTVRTMRFIQIELADMLAFGKRAIAAMVSDADRQAMAPWTAMLDACLAAAGGLDGAADPVGDVPARQHSASPYVYDPVPQRDSRWQDLWNRGVNAEALLYDTNMPVHAKTLMMSFKRLREVDVPEMMASIIVQTGGKPWQYYRDMSRQLWDEARHAMMGEVGFVARGVDWRLARLTHNFSYLLNTQCTPLERHSVLYFIEQGLMHRDTGKRFEWEVAMESGDPLAAVFQDYDWADEVLHARIGRDWYVTEMGDRKKAVAFGDQSWASITNNWEKVRDDGLTQHENWWPALYRQACAARGMDPDPKVLAFNTSYQGTRMDQKVVEVSG